LADAHAPSISVPLRFVLTGLAALAVGFGILVCRPDLLATYHYGPNVIALAHLFILGWLASLVMGSMYQLVPVALQTRLHSERLAKLHYLCHVAGFVGMVWTFWVWNMKQVGHFGSLLAFGAFLFIYNLARTLARIPRWDVVAAAIASALFWLFMTLCAGLFAVSAKCWPQISPFAPISLMHAHAHLGILGFFITLLVGVSFKLIPMFVLGEVQSRRRTWAALILINLGLASLFPTMLLASAWKFPAACVVATGLAIYGWEMLAILRARKRRALDWGLRSFLAALCLLAPLALLGLVLAWPSLPATEKTGQWENVYGVLAILGVLTFAIMGMLYKIIPFLVWYAAYSRHVGRAKVPALAEMYSPRLQIAGFATYLPGLAGLCIATVLAHERAIQAASALLAVSLVFFAVNVGLMLAHWFKPRLALAAGPNPMPARL